MTLQPEEPPAGPWEAVSRADLAVRVQELAGGVPERAVRVQDQADPLPDLAGPVPDLTEREAGSRPVLVAIDGRGASGKSSLTAALADLLGAAVVHTDDLAWHAPMFGWGHLLRDDVLAPLARGEGVSFRPPAWEAKGREGQIVVPPGSGLVLVEGTGAAQRDVADLLDVVLWVQADFAEAERRGIARDVEHGMNGDAEESAAFWHEWMAHELAFFAHDRPWERADLVVAGTPTIGLEDDQVAVSSGPLRR